MARSPSHRLGQIIGDQLESSVQEPLADIANEFNLYLDYHHSRKARGGKKRVTWKDGKGNTHILDYVIEEGGSETVQGRPRAFIEIAWRRYKRHSKNKAQEIEGAIIPLADTHQDSHPYLGVVLAGQFTEASLKQFRSNRFNLIYCPYESILQAFKREGLDVSSEEDSSDRTLQGKVDAFERTSKRARKRIAEHIRELHSEQFKTFFDTLRSSFRRRVESVLVLPLYGINFQFGTIRDAIQYISDHDSPSSLEFARYELNVRYSNRDEIRGIFHSKERAIEFLEKQEFS